MVETAIKTTLAQFIMMKEEALELSGDQSRSRVNGMEEAWL
jgi:hypothetical protein